MDDPPPQSPYKTLNVPKDATLATIRSAHRKLVLSCHPDKVQDESAKKEKAEQFHQVQQAYEILSDENRRQRYDEKIKLAELRAEMAEERSTFSPRRPYEYPSPRNGSTSKFEMRGNAMYETREPPSNRYDEPDIFSATYAEVRPSTSRKYTEDRYTPSSARKTPGSGRMQEERKKSRAYDDEDDDRRRRERREKEAERAAEAKERDQRTRQRDREKKKNMESKSRGKFETMEDDISDSEEDRYHNKGRRDSLPKRRSGDEGGRKRSGDERKRSGDERRKDRDEPRRSSKREEKELYDELEYKTSRAQDHISRTRDAVEPLPRRSEGGRSRAASTLDARKPPPPPPTEKRPSARRSESRAVSPIGKSGKDRRSPDTMAPQRPSMPGHSSESVKNKSFFGGSSSSRREAQRSATYQPSPEAKPPSMRRSETMPIDRMRPGNPVPLKSSNLKNMKANSDISDSSSDSDSEMTEENHPPPRPPLERKTTFGISQGGAYVVEPEKIQPYSKESRRTSERPSLGSRGGSTRTPPVARAMSSAFPSDERRPGLGRHESVRVPPLKSRDSGRSGELYGEFTRSPTEDAFRRSPKTSGDDERHARPYSQKHYPRRDSEEAYRDDYPGSHRPRMGRSESQQVRV